ncbi:2-oxoacid:acceptor oxidoreductase family protein, partial [bacterium]|nr:2-oxoacid:acceptor oxidoreductase family protein [bacterium]
MSDSYNILIVGVGGQGVLLASEIISEVAIRANLDVKKSEVHGMSQRGG